MPGRASLTYDNPASRALAIASCCAGASVEAKGTALRADLRPEVRETCGRSVPAGRADCGSATPHSRARTAQAGSGARTHQHTVIVEPRSELVAQIRMIAPERNLRLQVAKL